MPKSPWVSILKSNDLDDLGYPHFRKHPCTHPTFKEPSQATGDLPILLLGAHVTSLSGNP